MEKTFETPAAVRLHVQNEVGLVAITATRSEETVVWLEAHTPGGEELVERARQSNAALRAAATWWW